MSLLDQVIQGDLISPDRLATMLRTTKTELAFMAGLSRDAVSKTTRILQRSTQTRMREVVEILSRVAEWAGSPMAAYAW